MNILNSILIKRSPAIVLDLVKNPENMPRWNPKVTHVSPSIFSDIQLGYRYAITYCMHKNSKATTFQAEIIHFELPKKLVIRLSEPAPSAANRSIEERFELAEQDGGTLLT